MKNGYFREFWLQLGLMLLWLLMSGNLFNTYNKKLWTNYIRKFSLIKQFFRILIGCANELVDGVETYTAYQFQRPYCLFKPKLLSPKVIGGKKTGRKWLNIWLVTNIFYPLIFLPSFYRRLVLLNDFFFT